MDELRDGANEAVSRICVYLMPSESPGYHSPSLSLAYVRGAHHSFLDRVTKKWISLAVSCTAVEAEHLPTHSYFPLGGKSQAERVSLGPELCHLGGG